MRHNAVLLALLLLAPAGAASAQQQGLGQSFGGLQVQGDQPIAIESDQLDVDDRERIATFSGSVFVEQGETSMRAERLVVHYTQGADEGEDEAAPARSNMPGGSNEIERLEASGQVEITSADQVATAEQADFDMATQIVVMSGDVVLSQGPNVATGCRLTIQMDTGVARLQSTDCQGASGGSGAGNQSGRVRMLLTPGSEEQQ
ncbi:LptA/OstA family protein [Aureimonas mangrovi]|uniref:LptA/OstA family protein n=1 Tax=Aureimonas mangrovi TaxID=2758041 RepID=UPI001FE874FB|nr:LptA/OstA family protein [Aureimonas mangrovi]